jgi:hypothetical protein
MLYLLANARFKSLRQPLSTSRTSLLLIFTFPHTPRSWPHRLVDLCSCHSSTDKRQRWRPITASYHTHRCHRETTVTTRRAGSSDKAHRHRISDPLPEISRPLCKTNAHGCRPRTSCRPRRRQRRSQHSTRPPPSCLTIPKPLLMLA